MRQGSAFNLVFPLCLALSGPALAEDKVHWSYEGHNGPEHWAGLSDKFAMCGEGRLQSPFDIVPDIAALLPELTFDYAPAPLSVLNNGHTIQVNYSGESALEVGGARYRLLQFHFHSPSEYSIARQFFPMVAHLVHAAEDGTLAVVGVMISEGDANSEIAKIWDAIPASGETNTVAGATVDASAILPGSTERYLRFMGSLTTPPCSEGVHWHMLSEPITMSAEQIAAFRAIYDGNARPIQDENNRLVVAN